MYVLTYPKRQEERNQRQFKTCFLAKAAQGKDSEKVKVVVLCGVLKIGVLQPCL